MEMWSVAGLIGLSLVGAALFGYVWALLHNLPINAPDWLVMLVTLVVKHFYDEQSKKNDKNGGNGAS